MRNFPADRLVVVVVTLSLVFLSWLVLTIGGSVPMTGAIDTITLLLFMGVWAVGMLAMMLPSVLPIILMVAGATRTTPAGDEASSPAQRVLQPIQFVLGYYGIWSLVGLAAYFGLVFLFRFYPPFSSLGQLAGSAAGAAVFLAGVYQLSPLKQRALQACRSPMDFIMTKWRTGRFGRFLMGLNYGFFCTKCCWAFMAVLVVVGAMNLLWMVLFAGVIFVEKVFPHGIGVSKGFGILLMASGVILVAIPPS